MPIIVGRGTQPRYARVRAHEAIHLCKGDMGEGQRPTCARSQDKNMRPLSGLVWVRVLGGWPGQMLPRWGRGIASICARGRAHAMIHMRLRNPGAPPLTHQWGARARQGGVGAFEGKGAVITCSRSASQLD